MKTLTLTLFLIAAASAGIAQQLPQPPAPIGRADLPMDVSLLELSALVEAEGGVTPRVRAEVRDRMLALDALDRMRVEVVGLLGRAALGPGTFAAVGGERTNAWRHRAEAAVPLERMRALADALPPGYRLHPAWPLAINPAGGEGATAMQSDTYAAGGSDGSGKTIGVIDLGFNLLTSAVNAGDAPSARTQVNYTPNTFQNANDGPHGTGCTEAAFDHCPGATWILYKIDTITDLGSVVDHAIDNDVDVLSHSVSYFGTGWADNSGDACLAANDAADNGILFFTAAGNWAQRHYEADFAGNGDDWHDFSAGGDETIDVPAADQDAVTINLAWDGSGGTYNLDLYLYDAAFNIVASSTNSGDNSETISYTNNTGVAQTFHIGVFRSGSGITNFELFFRPTTGFNSFEYPVATGSTASPSNAGSPNVLSVGAVAFGDHGSPNGTSGIIKNYSSQGPSNGGFTLPDLTGTTDTGTTSYSGPFTGTSCATPNTAGAACAFWSSVPGLNADAVRWLLTRQAREWRDWGAPGDDNVYGNGGTILHPHASNRTWMARSYGNVLNLSTAPYHTFAAAYAAAADGGRILMFPGGTFPESFQTTGKSVLVETTGPSATLGSN